MKYDSIASAYLKMHIISESTEDEIIGYHGTNAHAYLSGKIERFHTNTERGAAFFSSDPDIARQYGERTYTVGIKLKNPLIVHGNGQNWSGISPETKVSGSIPDKLRKSDSDRANKLNQIYRELGGEDADLKGHFEGHEELKPHHNIAHITDATTTDNIAKAAKRFGYDGVIFKDIHDEPVYDKHLYKPTKSNIYAVFHSDNIKIY